MSCHERSRRCAAKGKGFLRRANAECRLRNDECRCEVAAKHEISVSISALSAAVSRGGADSAWAVGGTRGTLGQGRGRRARDGRLWRSGADSVVWDGNGRGGWGCRASAGRVGRGRRVDERARAARVFAECGGDG